MSTMTYSVPGMTCGHCQQSIETEVGGLDGVASVSVDLATKQVTVDGTAADDAIRAAIVEAGYEADPAV